MTALLVGASVSALTVPAPPPVNRPVVDQTQTLSSSDIDAIAQTINESRTKKDYQIGVLMIPTLGNDEYLEGYSLKVARDWAVGEKGKDNGVLLLVVKNDHQMRIEVGRGLEGDLTDAEAGFIVRNTLTPAFRKNDFAGGINQAVANIAAQVEGMPLYDTSAVNPGSTVTTSTIVSEVLALTLFTLFWFLPWLGSLFARTKRWWAGGATGLLFGLYIAFIFEWPVWAFFYTFAASVIGLLFDKAVSKNYANKKKKGVNPSWWAGGTIFPGGGSSSGGWRGSGGGFGGGGFSGGGSSGGW